MRIAQVVPQLVAGGLERMAVDLAMSLSARGHTVELFWLNASEPEERLAARGIAAHDCSPGPFRIPGVPHRLTRILRKFKADLLHAHSGVWYTTSVAGVVLRKPLVFTDHGRYLPESRRDILLQRWWCAHVTDEVVTVSSQLSEYVLRNFHLGYLPEVVDNGIDLAPFQAPDPARRRALRDEWGFTDSDVVVVMSGRLVEVKNHVGLLEAMAKAGVDSLRAIVLGAGPLEPELRARAAQLGLEAQVRFLGFRQDVPDCLLAADIFAMPSDSEGLPLALIEAMAAGLPIVASAVGGIPDALGSPQGGLLIQPRDTAALASALVRLATDTALRGELGALSKGRASAYTLDRMTDRYERIYRARATRTAR